MSETEGLWESVKPKIWPVIMGGVVAASYVWIEHVPSSDVIASSSDRIIPAASRDYSGDLDMAEGALNPDKLEVRVCEADTNQTGQELVFVYDGKRQVGTVGEEGYITIAPYEGSNWRCI